ncbi:hypothetical protein QJQ45_001576 [Haematococcus lacustris]|nr:hypothetical protein QJQ45_001576 [Haematococcus lacustris]
MKWVSHQHNGRERGVAVFLRAGCFSQGRWKAMGVQDGFRKVVEQPSKPSTFDRPDRLVIVDEFRTSRVSSSVHTPQPCELHLPRNRPRPEDWVPPAGLVIQRLVRQAWSQRHGKYVWGLLWCHERIGESMQRPLELCSYEGLEALPPVGKEYQQGYKLGLKPAAGRVVLVDEHRTTRVSSAVNGKQPCEEKLNTLSATRPAGWKPPAGQVEPRLVRPAWSQERGQPVRGLVWCPVVAPRKPPQAPRSSQSATQPAASKPGPSTPPPAKCSKHTEAEQAAEPTQPTKAEHAAEPKSKAAKAKPAPQPGRWLDRDCNAALNMQRIGESRWRPLELCYWPDQGALPAKGKEYPSLGYKRVRDKPTKAQEQQQPAEAQ